jgi:hypothetical protein
MQTQMKFKHFFENYDELINEATINMGDFTEVLFAIGLLHYTLKNKITSDDILETINNIPSMPYENTFSHDNYDVAIQLEGKSSIDNLINGNINKLSDDHKNEIKNIINKIANNIPKLKTIHKVEEFIKRSKSIESSNFIIVIKSMGSKVAQANEIKSDVSMELISKNNVEVPNDIKKIIYSVKYAKDKADSKVSEISIFTLILRMGNIFRLPMVNGLEGMRELPYKVNAQSGSKWLHELFYDNPTFKQLSLQENHLFNFIRKFYTTNVGDKESILKQFLLEFNNELLVKEKKQPEFSNKLYDFLEKEIFGKDSADIVRIDINGINDIDVDMYNKMRNNYLIDFSTRPSKSKNLIFKFEAVAKDESRFVLFWIDNHRDGTVQVYIGDSLLK